MDSINTFGSPKAVAPMPAAVKVQGGKLSLTIEPRSVTVEDRGRERAFPASGSVSPVSACAVLHCFVADLRCERHHRHLEHRTPALPSRKTSTASFLRTAETSSTTASGLRCSSIAISSNRSVDKKPEVQVEEQTLVSLPDTITVRPFSANIYSYPVQ